MNDQRTLTKSFVAEHLKNAHRSHPNDAMGCMICSAWRWAREMRLLDDSAVKEILESIAPPIDVTSVSRANT